MRKWWLSLLFCCFYSIVAFAELPFDKLALYMSFDKIAKDTVIDESGNKNDGKIIKAKVAAGKGKYGDGMEFKGGDNLEFHPISRIFALYRLARLG